MGELPLQAQWQQGMRTPKNLPRPRYSARHVSTLATKRAERQAALQIKINERKQIEHLKKATVTIELPKDDFSTAFWIDPKATAFVIEENHQGKKRLWGVSASHYRFVHPQWEDPATHTLLPLEFVAQGSFGFNDVTLFPIPQAMQPYVEPLTLASRPVKLGDRLHSVGYFNNGFQVEQNRIVKEIAPHRIITSLKIEEEPSREGACGGPVFNEAGEVVGMHVGSSAHRQIGFVIPAEHIQELLVAYYHRGKASHPLIFKGKELGKININEYICSLEVWKGDRLLNSFFTYHNRLAVDYEHLEDLVDTSGADKLVLLIERTPFSVLDADQSTRHFTLTYSLLNHNITYREEP